MYPAQTSFIPVQIALARFLESQGLKAIFANYPYWYLGTTPFRYLTGPILPAVLVFFHWLLPNFSLFELMFFLIAVCWVIGALGVYWLVISLANSSTVRGVPSGHLGGVSLARLAAIFYIFGLLVPFLFRFSGGLYLIAFSFLPYILLLYSQFLGEEKDKRRKRVERMLVALIVFVVLIDTSIIPSLFLGMTAIFLAQVGWKKAEKKLKKSLVLGAWCLVLVTLWYSPGYWLTSLTGPSLAGKGRLGVIFQLSKLLPTALALAMAVFSVKFFKKRHLLRDFTFYWLFIFGFLTLIRFFSDPDFWLDWMSYGVELQLGLAVFGGLLLDRLLGKQKYQISNIKIFSFLICVFGFWFLVFGFTFKKYVLRTFQKDISQTVEYRIGKFLSETVKPPSTSSGQGARVFLSGTTAFWLNAFFDVAQVRGGVDQASVHPTWRKAAWEIREGSDVKKSIQWLDELEIDYLVVHSSESAEFYHDFVYPEKFEKTTRLKKIYDYQGDKIFQRR